MLGNSIFALVYWAQLANAACLIGAFYAALKAVQVIRIRYKTTALRGPSRPSFMWGIAKVLFASPDQGAQYEKWAEEYGGVYDIPWSLGGRKIVLWDPKAIAHTFGREPWTYVLTPLVKLATESFVGEGGILTATHEGHRRQRKTLAPAFSNAAIRNLTPVFYDLAYKAKGYWDTLIESDGGDEVIIEMQEWTSRISLDTIGIAGFSHDFGSLDGKPVSVTEVFDALITDGKSLNRLFIALAEALPLILRLPTRRSKLLRRLNDSMGEIATALLSKLRKEREAGIFGESEEKSILGILIAAEREDRQLQVTHEEVVSQGKILLIAGYETSSISLTWALIELCKHPDMQTKLRTELLELGADPTYDQFSTHLPYLDAVIQEILRLHPPVHDFTRMATEDDVIPLSKPVYTRSGKFVDHISVAKGERITISVPAVNCSTALWGADAREFKPERWIEEEGIPSGAKEIQGYRHLFTFIDGPRMCLGKGFAIAELKAVLSVLVKHFVFELRDGPETRIETVTGVLPRPKVVGEEGAAVPMRVRRFA